MRKYVLLAWFVAGIAACSSDGTGDNDDLADISDVATDSAPDDTTGDVETDTTDVSDATDVENDADVETDVADADADGSMDTNVDVDVSDADVMDVDTSDVPVDPDTDVADVTDAADVEDASDATDTSMDAADAEAAYVQIGTGEAIYEAIEETTQLSWVQGFQGGFHIWGGFLADGFDPMDVMHSWEIEHNGEVIASTIWIDDLPRVLGRYEFAGVTVTLGPSLAPEDLDGETVTMTVTIESQDGTVVSDSIDVVTVCCEFL